jgi:hypothetical protein
MKPKWLIRLYPAWWQARYGEEFAALLEQTPVSLSSLLNVLLWALDAHLNVELEWRFSKMIDTLRRSTLTVFCAYIGFIVAGMGFGGLADDSPFAAANQTYLWLGFTWRVVQIGAVAAFAAIVIGGLPLAVGVIKLALTGRRWHIMALVCTPLLALVVLLLFMVSVTTLARPDSSGSLAAYQPLLAIALHGLFTLVAAVSAAAVSRAILLSEIDEQPFRFAVIPSVITTFAMGVVVIASVVWGVLAQVYLPAAFYSGSYGYYGSQTVVSWIVVIFAMLIVTGVSASASLRGFRSRRAA